MWRVTASSSIVSWMNYTLKNLKIPERCAISRKDHGKNREKNEDSWLVNLFLLTVCCTKKWTAYSLFPWERPLLIPVWTVVLQYLSWVRTTLLGFASGFPQLKARTLQQLKSGREPSWLGGCTAWKENTSAVPETFPHAHWRATGQLPKEQSHCTPNGMAHCICYWSNTVINMGQKESAPSVSAKIPKYLVWDMFVSFSLARGSWWI